MKRRRFLLASTAALAGGTLVADSGALSSTEVERDVKVEVVADDEAFLRLTEDGGNDGDLLFEESVTTPAEFSLKNQSTSTVDVEIDLEGPFNFDDPEMSTGELDPGKETDVTIVLTNESENSGEIEFDVTAEDGGFEIHATRTLVMDPLSASFGNEGGSISSGFKIESPDNIQEESVRANGQDTELDGTRYKLDDPGELDCEPSETIELTVEGESDQGAFYGTVELNCTGEGSNNSEDELDGEDSNDNDDNDDSDNGNDSDDNDDSDSDNNDSDSDDNDNDNSDSDDNDNNDR